MARTTIKLSNGSKPAPKKFRKWKRFILALTVVANAMVTGWGFEDQLLVTRLQLWITVGIGGFVEALDHLLANGEEYTQVDDDVNNS